MIYLCKSKNKKKIMVINNELKFAEKVILIDASYINKVTGDLSQHFG